MESCKKRKLDANENKQLKKSQVGEKFIPIDRDCSKIGIFNDSLRKMISAKDVEEGKPFTLHYGNGTISCVMWTGKDVEEIKEIVKTMEEYPEIYTKPIDIEINQETSWVTFNQGSPHYPLRLAIKELYTSSSSYCSIDRINDFEDSNHNFLKIFKLLEALCELFLLIEQNEYPLQIFTPNVNLFEISRILMDNLWIKDGNIRNENPFEQETIIISPFKVNAKKKDVPTVKKEFLFKVFKEIGKEILNLKKQDFIEPQQYVTYPFKDIESIIRFFSSGTRNKWKIYYSLFQVKEAIGRVLVWFQNNQHWPQIVWNDVWAEHYIKEERCMDLDCYNDQDINDFAKKIDLTGAAWWPEPKEDEIFSNLPFLIMITWKESKLCCKIAFDHIVHITSGNIISESFKLNAMEEHVEKCKIIKGVPDAFFTYCREVQNLHEKGIILPKKSILERTIFYFDAVSKKTKFKLCMYNTVTSVKRKWSSLYCASFRKVSETLYALLNLYNGPDNEKQNCWEMGVTLVCLYKYLIRVKKIGIETNRKLSAFLEEFQVKDFKRLWIFPYRGGWTFSLLLAFIFNRDLMLIPSMKELCDSKFMKKWMATHDLYDSYWQSTYDDIYKITSAEEYKEFQYMTIQMNRPHLIEDPIILESKWRNIHNLENAQNVIKTFTHCLKAPLFNCVMLRNRHAIQLSFTMDGSDQFLEAGEGRGVFQEGLTLYWTALMETRMFSPLSKRGRFQTKNLTSNHWFVLGLVIGHCMLNNYSFFIDQPLCFFKLLMHGLKDFNPTDLCDINREQAINLLELYFMSQFELDQICLDFEDGIDPMLSGSATPGTIEVYIAEICKKSILKEYSFGNKDSSYDLEEMRRGFSVTVPDIKPSYRQLWAMFAQNAPIDAQLLLEKIAYSKEHSTSEKHCTGCFSQEHMMTNGGLCPLSCLGSYINEMQRDELVQFVYFVTGSTILTKNNYQEIIVDILELDEGEVYHYPFASTCIRTITFYLDTEIETTKEESYEKFKKELKLSMTKGLGFGVK